MTLPTFRSAFAALLVLALLAAPDALSRPLGQSQLAPLPSVLPPTPLGRPMVWSHPSTAPPSAAFAGGEAAIGVARGINGPALAARLGLRAVDWLPKLRLVQVTGPPGRLAALSRGADRRIRYVEPLSAARPAHVRNDPLTYAVDPATGAPYEWQFHTVGVDQALNLARGDPNILVGVVDSGITPVPDLKGKIAETFWDTKIHASATDVLGHGTFVSSIIASRDDDGFGLAGFCGACRLAVFKADPLTDVQVAEGIQRLTDAHVRVINLSVVLDHSSPDVVDALDYATAAGVLVVAASGNEGQGSVDFPASYLQPSNGTAASGLAVGASDAKGARASFSNDGAQLSLVAPGTFNTGCTVGIIGAIPTSAPDFEESNSCAVTMTHADGARYAYASGTSFSAPEVAGIAALVWSAKPSLTSTQVANVLEQTATRPAGTGWSPTLGWGVVNANAAVESVTGRSSADTIGLSKLRVSRPRAAGVRILATVRASWGDDAAPAGLGAHASCRIAVGTRSVSASARLAAGLATCAFRLPKGSGGGEVKGSVSVASAGARASASFRFTVPGGRRGPG